MPFDPAPKVNYITFLGVVLFTLLAFFLGGSMGANLALKFLHIFGLALFVGGPFYMLIVTRERAKSGQEIFYHLDKTVEDIQQPQALRCFSYLILIALTGFLRAYIFGGFFSGIILAKIVATFIAMGITVYMMSSVIPETRIIFSQFKPEEKPPEELRARFWVLRRRRKNICAIQFGLGMLIVFFGVMA